MALPRFSEKLLARRMELGLSISQASRTLKLREDVLVAFEEGDFDHMPQSGYAQGMLSSYARYLGLNARELVDLFQEDIYRHKHGTSSHELRRRTRQTQSGRGVSGYEMVNEAGSRPKAYIEYRTLLPSGGGPAGDMGDFATTAPARPRSSHGPSYSASSYASTGYTGYAGSAAERYRADRTRPYNDPASQQRSSSSTARRRLPSSRRRDDDQSGRLIDEGQRATVAREDRRDSAHTGRLYRRDDVSTRRVRPNEYTDDMRYDSRPSPYSPASTISGRRSSRNIASVERPNVRRRAPRGRVTSGRGRQQRRGGIVGAVSMFLSDRSRALLALVLGFALILTLILVFSVSSCVDGRNQPAANQVVPVGTTDATDDASGSATGDASSDQGGSSAQDGADDDNQGGSTGADSDDEGGSGSGDADDADADDTDDEPTETVVVVRVASGMVSWIEITCDGVSEVAESVTGPWSATYTPTSSITIQAARPNVVTVTKNGEEVELSSHASGLGTVTIEGTPAASSGAAADGDGAAADDGAADAGAAATTE